ncbi:5'-nucleotidase domain-containing protein 1-like isoform X2 [Acanthaster planci]|uniref:5'-nucleotidase domain-containing protein 1 n=1 Tax=Acanthaster planci TaxID=133434 RepID=A0A8B7XNZ6_ACAPL|nr:5'-nucleotidase domain-containing protein 1-like isoform X2 [Acanthaster planci]
MGLFYGLRVAATAHQVLLSYNYSARVLVEKGYDESLLQPFEINKDFCIKGMVFDSANGDFLKLSDSGVILRASHGSRMMSDAEIQDKYGRDRQWQYFSQLESTLEQSDKFSYTENYYDLPCMVLLARLIDLQENKNGSLILPKVYQDVIEGYVKGFLYKEKQATILSACEEEPSKYLEQCSEHLKAWLRSLRDKCQMVFLLSSAHPVFANSAMSYILGEDWRSYFHILLLQARKPGFFSVQDPSKRPFYTVVDGQQREEVTELQEGQSYLEGNVFLFNEYIKKFTGKADPKVLYIGDSIRSDAHPSSKYGNWQNVLVLEEMEVEELIPSGPCTLDYKEEKQEEESIETPNIRSGPSEVEREFLLSNRWGSFFGDNLPVDRCKSSADLNVTETNPIRTNTLWTRLIRKHSSIAIPKLDYMADFPMNFKFETFSSSDWRKGFHPGMPKNVTC